MSKIIDIDEILSIFVEEPDKKLNVREVARMAGVTPTTASKHLKNLSKNKFLLKKKERNMILYSADTESQTFRDFKIYQNIKKIKETGVVDFINTELSYPETIILFGSYAKGENTKRSDIDLFILSESKKGIDCGKFQKILGAEIQTFIYSRKETEGMKTKNKELLNNIINGTKLSGFFEVFK